jgi:hypothetical protein
VAEGGKQSCFSDCATVLVKGAVDKGSEDKTPCHAVVLDLVELIGLLIKIFNRHLVPRMVETFIALFSSIQIGSSLQNFISQCIDVIR